MAAVSAAAFCFNAPAPARADYQTAGISSVIDSASPRDIGIYLQNIGYFNVGDTLGGTTSTFQAPFGGQYEYIGYGCSPNSGGYSCTDYIRDSLGNPMIFTRIGVDCSTYGSCMFTFEGQDLATPTYVTHFTISTAGNYSLIATCDASGGGNCYGRSGNFTGSNSATALALYSYSSVGNTVTTLPYTFNVIIQSNLTSPGTPAPPSSITINFPLSGGTTPDFSNWVISTEALPGQGSITINYGISSSTLNYSDTLSSYSPFINTNPIAITKTNSLFFPPLSIPVEWFAQATYVSGTTTIQSAIVPFFINPNDSNPTSTATDTILASPFNGQGSGNGFTVAATSTDCVIVPSFWSDPASNNIALIENAICGGFTYLFLPSISQQTDLGNNFKSLGDQIKNKPPFGYFESAYQAFNNFQNNGTSSLINTSTSSQFSTIFTPLDEAISALLWILFGFWVVRTFRHLDT